MTCLSLQPHPNVRGDHAVVTDETKPGTITVYVSIENSDDKLSQRDWSDYVGEFVEVMHIHAQQVYGELYSESSAAHQNACVAAAIPVHLVDELRSELIRTREGYGQDSIAWVVAPETEFI